MADLTMVTDPVSAAIFEVYKKRGDSESSRTYLGASIIGDACKRKLWYNFRWATKETHDGRLYRLFQTGHLAERRFVADLKSIGAEVFDLDPSTSQQFAFKDHGAHARGHMDAKARGFVGGGGKWHVVEFKTHSAKSFAQLQKDGVEKAKPEHYAQMTWYMGQAGLERALYLAVNKDTDDLYSERIKFSKDDYDAIQKKFEEVIFAATPPARIKDDPKYYLCGWCAHKGVCHEGHVPLVSCRTCLHSTPEPIGDGRWSCAKFNGDIPTDFQRGGCGGHLHIPALVPYADAVDAGDEHVVYKRKDNGLEFAEVTVDNTTKFVFPIYDSKELAAVKDHRSIADPEVYKFKTELPGSRFVG